MARLIKITCLLIAWAVSYPSHAVNFTVTKIADTADGTCDADCSLREAVIAANGAAGADTITLPAGTYTLTLVGTGENNAATGDLDIRVADVSINGATAATTIIDGNSIDRVFDVVGNITLTLSNVTVTGGLATGTSGGGITAAYPGTNLQLSNCVITNNSASTGGGGIYKTGAGSVVVSNCTISDNTSTDTGGAGGGGIVVGSGGSLTVTDSTISGNTSASIGGGIRSAGITALSNVTLSGNSANGNGGGIWKGSVPPTMDLSNVTITNNSADFDSDSSGDGGGIFYNAGTVNIKNTLIAANADSGGQAPDCSGFGTITSQEYNLIGNNTGCIFTPGTGDQVGTGGSPIDPLLSALGNYGGPTQTHLPLGGSPARDAGNPATPGSGGNACAVADQRGATRPVGSVCDIGAVEGWVLTCDIQMSQTTYTAGDTVVATVYRLANPGPDPVPVEAKGWIGIPSGPPTSSLNVGADGSISLPAGFDQDFGPVALFPASGMPTGAYELSCRLLDPVTGVLLAEDLNPFAIQ